MHNECWKKIVNGRQFRTYEGRTISDAAIDASERARALADELRGRIPPWANRDVTVGVAVKDGQYYVTAYKPGNPGVWTNIEACE